jgi:hypothetical protein
MTDDNVFYDKVKLFTYIYSFLKTMSTYVYYM